MEGMINLKKGLDINLKGNAAKKIFEIKSPECYALMPDDFTGITPKLMVKEQDVIKAGQTLFVDKNNPQLKFVSPVCGTVVSIDRGLRRKILDICISPSVRQEYVDFGVKDVSEMNADDIKVLLCDAGLFAFIRQRPYDIIADPRTTPRAIFISGFDSSPLAPDINFILEEDDEPNFQTGLDILAKIAPVYLNIRQDQQDSPISKVKNVHLSVFSGPHPAGNVGVQINHIAPINKGEIVWTLNVQSVIYIGRLLLTGRIDFSHLVAVTGSEVKGPSYCRLKVGASLVNVFNERVEEGRKLRYISGNVLTGKKIASDGFLGAFDSQVTVIPEGDDVQEEFGWIKPRKDEFSVSHSYFNWLMDKSRKYSIDARVKGGQRHMIMSGEYGKVFPMDILPEYLIKAILASDIDKMEALGIYEVAPEDFALCEFVDSSKMELQRIVREGLDNFREEMG